MVLVIVTFVLRKKKSLGNTVLRYSVPISQYLFLVFSTSLLTPILTIKLKIFNFEKCNDPSIMARVYHSAGFP